MREECTHEAVAEAGRLARYGELALELAHALDEWLWTEPEYLLSYDKAPWALYCFAPPHYAAYVSLGTDGQLTIDTRVLGAFASLYASTSLPLEELWCEQTRCWVAP